MTTNVLKLPGDYLINTPSGNITLDATGVSSGTAVTGTVRIIGNLDIIGNQTLIESTSSLIKDNIIILNAEETNAYVTLGNSGIVIDRGSYATLTNAATLLYVDSIGISPVTWTDSSGTVYQGLFDFRSAGTGTAIQAAALRTNGPNGTINFLGVENPYGMLNVKGTINYASRVLDNDDIPNKYYVDNRIYTGTNFAQKLQVGNTFVQLGDNSIPPNQQYFSSINTMFVGLGSTSNVVFKLIGTSAVFSGISLNNNVIQANTGSDLILQAGGNGSIDLNSALRLQDQTSIPLPLVNQTVLYASTTTGGGGTGIYFTNTNKSDELVSRRKAIIYSIIF